MIGSTKNPMRLTTATAEAAARAEKEKSLLGNMRTHRK
jgi:hypothetical protein